MTAYEQALRALALNDERFVALSLSSSHETVDALSLSSSHETVEVSGVDKKTHALVRLAGTLAIDAATPTSCQSAVDFALAAGAADGVFRTGRWQLVERRGWAGNETWENLVVWGWRDARKRVVVKLGDAPAAGHVSLPRDDLRGGRWRRADALSDPVYARSRDGLRDGLCVALDAWGSNLFDLTALDSGEG